MFAEPTGYRAESDYRRTLRCVEIAVPTIITINAAKSRPKAEYDRCVVPCVHAYKMTKIHKSHVINVMYEAQQPLSFLEASHKAFFMLL